MGCVYTGYRNSQKTLQTTTGLRISRCNGSPPKSIFFRFQCSSRLFSQIFSTSKQYNSTFEFLLRVNGSMEIHLRRKTSRTRLAFLYLYVLVELEGISNSFECMPAPHASVLMCLSIFPVRTTVCL